MRVRLAAAAGLLAALSGTIAACGSSASAPAVGADHPCAGRASPQTYRHVVWIVMENTDPGNLRQRAHYLTHLGRKCATARDYHAISHPSLPNYIALTSGGLHGVHTDASPSRYRLRARSIFGQLGPRWRTLAEDMPAKCEDDDSGRYAVRHNPAVYYRRIAAACAKQDVPLAKPLDLSARFTLIIPNLCHDMHDVCDTNRFAKGDRWARRFLPRILNSPQYRAGSTAVFVVWDEADSSPSNRIPLIALAPSVTAKTRARGRFDHYSLLRTTERMLGLPPLGQAAKAHSMRHGLGV